MVTSFRCVALVCAALGLLWLGGCGEEQAGSGDGQTQAQADPGAPIRGGRQLLGAWFNPSGDEIVGLEFTEGGKAIVTTSGGDPMRLGPTVTADYEALEGGRLRMTMPGGLTVIFTTGLNGDTLTLAPEQEPDQAERFTRLKNQSVADAHRAHAQQLAQRHEQMRQAVRSLLAQPKLVIVSSDPGLNLTREALEVSANADKWQGGIYTESNVTTLRQVQLSIVESSPGRPIRVRMDLGGVVGPPGQPPLQPRTEVFTAEGESSSVALVGQGRKIVSDSQVHGELVSAYEKIKAEREAEIAKLTDRFKDYAWLQGGYRVQTQAGVQEDTRALVFEKIEGEPAFRFMEIPRAQEPNWNQRISFSQPALVVFSEGKPAVMMPGQWILTPTEEDGKLVLRGRNRANQEAVYTIAEALTRQDVEERRSAVRSYLDSMRNGVKFRGRIVTEGSQSYPGPRVLEFKLDEQRNLVGTLAPLELDGVWSIGGQAVETFIGAMVNIQVTGFTRQPPTRMMEIGRTPSTLALDWVNGVPHLTGKMNGGYFPGMMTFTPVSDEQLQAERQRVVEALSRGAFFTTNTYASRNTPPPIYTLKLDQASGKINGFVGFGGRLDVQGPALLTGELAEQDGFVVIKLKRQATTNVPGEYNQPEADLCFWVLADEQGLTLSGWSSSASRNPRSPVTVVLTPVQEVGAEHRVYLTALNLGAGFSVAEKPQPGEKVTLVVRGATRAVNMHHHEGRYVAQPGVAAVHAGLIREGEVAIVRLTYAPPFGQATFPASAQNGVTMQEVRRPYNITLTTPTFTIEKVPAE